MISYSEYLDRFFSGTKVQKLSIDAGFSCPNRDGTIGTGGCIYCRNDSFTPGYCDRNKSVAQQIEEGKRFFSKKYPDMKYLAYFQSYTNTHNPDISYLKKLYDEALSCEDILGIVIGTRPDTLSNEVIELLSSISKDRHVFLEIGAETSHDSTLSRINRNHKWKDVELSVLNASEKGIHCGLHLIAGLPGENKESILETIKKACALPIETLKIHQLQILYNTPLYNLWKSGKIEVNPYNLEDYLQLCAEIIDLVPSHIVIERFISQSPPKMVAAPQWNIKNYQFIHRLQNLLKDKVCKTNNFN